MRPPFGFALSIALLAVPVGSAGADEPTNSTIDRCLIVCPAGDFVFHMVIRDFANNPIPNLTVEVDFCDCPQVRLCPPGLSDPYATNGCRISAPTDSLGRVNFPIRAGGICSGLHATIRADGVSLASREVASPDQNGDLVVNGTDVAIANGKLGTSDTTADFDCSQTVTSADLEIQQQHLGHTCDNIVPARPPSWGRIKTIYR